MAELTDRQGWWWDLPMRAALALPEPTSGRLRRLVMKLRGRLWPARCDLCGARGTPDAGGLACRYCKSWWGQA
jgi:hypothetical protein